MPQRSPLSPSPCQQNNPRYDGVVLFHAPFPKDGRTSHELLALAAEQYSGITGGDWSLTLSPMGKPAFSRYPGLHFNITHSGEYWLCAFAPQPVGLDLQVHRTCRRQQLSRRYFSGAEDAFLRQSHYRDFFDLWSAKEAYCKMTGQGLFSTLTRCPVVSPEGDFPKADGAVFRLLPWHAGYSLCLCTALPLPVHFVALEENPPPRHT